jgi:hypothetical protein
MMSEPSNVLGTFTDPRWVRVAVSMRRSSHCPGDNASNGGGESMTSRLGLVCAAMTPVKGSVPTALGVAGLLTSTTLPPT